MISPQVHSNQHTYDLLQTIQAKHILQVLIIAMSEKVQA